MLLMPMRNLCLRLTISVLNIKNHKDFLFSIKKIDITIINAIIIYYVASITSLDSIFHTFI